MHFGCYSLKSLAAHPEFLYRLGNGTLVRIANEFDFQIPRENEDGTGSFLPPTSALLRELTAKVAPHAHLQQNIAFAREMLGENAYTICKGWLEDTHALDPVAGSFLDPTIKLPDYCNYMVWSGSVARWQERRLAVAKSVGHRAVGQVCLPMSDLNVMAAGEHAQVELYLDEYGELPTQAAYADRFIIPALAAVNFRVAEPVPIHETKGDDVLTAFLNRHPQILGSDTKTLIVGNAPNTIQAAGQFRTMARAIRKDYDEDGTQLYMIGDGIRIANPGEGPAHGAVPEPGLGQILRNFKLLVDNIEFANAA